MCCAGGVILSACWAAAPPYISSISMHSIECICVSVCVACVYLVVYLFLYLRALCVLYVRACLCLSLSSSSFGCMSLLSLSRSDTKRSGEKYNRSGP